MLHMGDFYEFLNKIYAMRRNPLFGGLGLDKPDASTPTVTAKRILRTEVEREGEKAPPTGPTQCVIHADAKDGHILARCKDFVDMTSDQKRELLMKKGLCFICLGKHMANMCPSKVGCDVCKKRHLTVLHDLMPFPRNKLSKNRCTDNRVVQHNDSSITTRSNTTRSKFSHKNDKGLPFSRTYVVNIRMEGRKDSFRCCVIVDDQSLETYIHPKLLEMTGMRGNKCTYRLKTLAGLSDVIRGEEIRGLEIQASNGGTWFKMPTTRTNPFIPDTTHERVTKEVISNIPHLSHLAEKFEPEDTRVETLVLIGLDMSEVMRSETMEALSPPVHRTPLGWSLTGYLPRDSVPQHCLAQRGDHESGRVCRNARQDLQRQIASPTSLPRHESRNTKHPVFEVMNDSNEVICELENEEFDRVLKARQADQTVLKISAGEAKRVLSKIPVIPAENSPIPAGKPPCDLGTKGYHLRNMVQLDEEVGKKLSKGRDQRMTKMVNVMHYRKGTELSAYPGVRIAKRRKPTELPYGSKKMRGITKPLGRESLCKDWKDREDGKRIKVSRIIIHSRDNIETPLATDLIPYGRRTRSMIQVRIGTFWRPQRKYHLNEISQRHTRHKVEEAFMPGDVINIRGTAARRASWRVARVIRAHAGREGRMRWVGRRGIVLGHVNQPVQLFYRLTPILPCLRRRSVVS